LRDEGGSDGLAEGGGEERHLVGRRGRWKIAEVDFFKARFDLRGSLHIESRSAQYRVTVEGTYVCPEEVKLLMVVRR